MMIVASLRRSLALVCLFGCTLGSGVSVRALGGESAERTLGVDPLGASVAAMEGDHKDVLLKVENPSPSWGIAMGVRYARIPFRADDKVVADVFPMFYYDGEKFFLDGLEGGYRLWQDGNRGLEVLGRYRFFDIPKEYQNENRGDALDFGLRAYWEFEQELRLEAELLSDDDGRLHAIGRLSKQVSGNGWWLRPELELLLKSTQFNTRYYGFGEYDLDGGLQLKGRVNGRMHVWRNLYLEGEIEAGFLDNPSRDSPVVDTDIEWGAYVGLGFFEWPEEGGSSGGSGLEAQPYIRLAQGWGTSSSLAQIIEGDIRTEDVAVNMTSLFYGHPLSDTLFGLPIEVYLTPGVVHHYSSNVQGAATEYVLGVKAYYTIPMPWRVRIGVAEGISYTDSITYYEASSMEDKGYRASKLLNYLDFSVDLNLGDVSGVDALHDLWLGYSIHHRSGIFETSSAFGRISGGSNFNTLYLQWATSF